MSNIFYSHYSLQNTSIMDLLNYVNIYIKKNRTKIFNEINFNRAKVNIIDYNKRTTLTTQLFARNTSVWDIIYRKPVFNIKIWIISRCIYIVLINIIYKGDIINLLSSFCLKPILLNITSYFPANTSYLPSYQFFNIIQYN